VTSRSETKLAIRHALRTHEWVRSAATADNGDNCYTETFTYFGLQERLRGLEILLTWEQARAILSIPMKMLESPMMSKTDSLVKQLGYGYLYTAPAHSGDRGDRHYYSHDGGQTQMLVQRVGNTYTFTSPLPPVE
jgi:hypothetical protein